MLVNIQAIHFDADVKLKEHIQNRMDKLETFSDKVLKAEVYLKLENEGAPVQEKVVEIRLHVPGNDLFAKETSRSFEDGVDAVAEQLRRQLVKLKEKISAK